MKLLDWKYTKRRGIEAKFDHFPYSTVIFRPIHQYYFVYNVQWSNLDDVVTRVHLKRMEWLLNKELGADKWYLARKSRHLIE